MGGLIVRGAAPGDTKVFLDGQEIPQLYHFGGLTSVVSTENRYVEAAAEAMEQVFGKKTVYMRSGGSIPIAGLLGEHLGIPVVMMGFGLPDDNLHAPNEKFHLPNFYGGIEAVGRYFELLGR